MNVTVDASVWLSAASPSEPDSDSAAALIETLLSQHTAFHQPNLFIIELCATIARRTRRRELAVAAGRHALSTSGLVMHVLDHRMAALAADIAARCALRSADAVYVATASTARATLVTLDKEVLERAATIVDARTPAELLHMVS